MTTLLGNGVYSIPDAARLTGLKSGRVREWFIGRNGRQCPPVFSSDFHGHTTQQLISFFDLVEVFIAGQLRNFRVSLQTIRKVHVKLQSQFGSEHPFCSRELKVGGKDIFVTGLDSTGQEQIRNALTDQKAFPEIIRPFLKNLDYDQATQEAIRWRIASGVVVDPGICFGQPIVDAAGIPTSILFKAFCANGESVDAVAYWYDVSPDDVRAAVAFERSLVA